MYFFLAWKECWLITTRKLPVTVAEVKTIFTLKFAGHRSPHRGRRAAVWAAAAAECRLVLQFSANSQWGRSAKIFVSNTKIFYHHRQHQKSLDVVFQVVTHPKHICVYTFKKIFVSRPDRNICDTQKYLWHSKIFVTLKNICDPCWTSAAMRRGAGRGTPPPSPRGSRRSTPTSSSCTLSTPGPGRTSPRCRQGHTIYKYNVQFLHLSLSGDKEVDTFYSMYYLL